MTLLNDLLKQGFFPKELPPPFNTVSFADLVTTASSLPPDFSRNAGQKPPLIANTVTYSHARGGFLRRKLSIPNPVLHFCLCKEIVNSWNVLSKATSGTPYSATRPIHTPRGHRAIDSATLRTECKVLASSTRLNSRYVLRTDISRFYHSIYTHAIPWALHSKSKAKKNRKMSLLGNRLDYWVRCGQDGQTVGIPIGPDTSLLIAELIMQVCDRNTMTRIDSAKGFRVIDNYEISFKDRSDAEAAFYIIEQVLGEFELALNPKKTKILNLPQPTEPKWVRELKSFRFRPNVQGQRDDLFQYFSMASELSMEYPGEAIPMYSVSRLRSLEVKPDNWDLFQRLLLNCVAPEPATLRFVLENLIGRVNAGAPPVIDEIEEVLNALIIEHAPLGHSSEVAWALWGAIALEIQISADAVSALSNADNSVVALLALDAESRGLTSTSLNSPLWSSYMTSDELYGTQWLLSYEGNVQGWLPTMGGGDHVKKDPNFGFLQANDVHFYDKSLAAPIVPPIATKEPSVYVSASPWSVP